MEKIKRKTGLKYRERIYISGKAFKSLCFDKKSDAIIWKNVKIAEKRQFELTGVKMDLLIEPNQKLTATNPDKRCP